MSHTIGQNNQQLNNSSQVDMDSLRPEEPTRSPMSISDVDYEFLFNQLLEGIAHGWHDRRIVKFFVRLGDRAEQEDWVAWLERLKEKASGLPSQSRRQLGTMMIRLGELTRSTTEANKIGAASHRIGKELLFNKIESVWEYVGSDLPSEAVAAELEEQKPAERTITDEVIEAELELAKRLPADFNAISDEVIETDASPKAELEAESRLNPNKPSDRKSESPVTALDKLMADLVDFPESIPQVKQDSNTISSSKSRSDLSPLKQEELDEIEAFSSNPDNSQGGDKLSEIAESINTGSEIEAFDLSQVMNLIQEDEELARQISRKLNGAIANEQVPLDRSSLELIESWFNLGLKQVSMGDFSKAIVSWEKALKIDPNLSEAWHNRGSALGRLGDYRAAIESFQNALTIDPDNYQAWNDCAHALYQLQEWNQAADSWSNAIKIMPGNHLFWYNRGCALEQLQRWNEAIACHEKALEIVPDFQPARSRYINLISDSSRSN